MDSISKLPLLEIAGEDDSLLSNVPSVTNVFSCSPLISSLRSEGREGFGAVDSEIPSSSLDSANKENTNWNKPEAPRLSVEPLQMKRKKKGGYNLRKSLAWDQAFFTEQGVLNPMELSMISGTATPNAELNLDVIHEEEPAATSLALQEIEENLFKHSSEGAVHIEDRKIGGAGIGLSPKPGALTKQTRSPASLAKRKVLAVNDVFGNRSKRSACPRPVPSSSKPDPVKVPSKESKVTRIPGPKSNVSARTTTARGGMLSTGSSKRNQNAHPATNVQKNAGAKGLSKIPRAVPSSPKVDPRTLTKQARKHLDNSVSETRPPSRMHQPGSEANNVSEACLSQGVSDTGEKKQQTLFQTTKSSGLRMPSPSLGFFSQAKVSSSHNQLQKSSKPSKTAESNIPKLRKLETMSVNLARLPHAPREKSEIIEGAAENCPKESSLSDVKSEPSMQIVERAAKDFPKESNLSDIKSEQSMQIDNKQLAGVEDECDSLGFEKLRKQLKVESIPEHVNLKSKEQRELHKSENVSSMEDVVFPRHENKLLSKSHTHEQLEKEADHPLDDKLYDVLSNGDHSLFQEPQSMHYHGMQRTSNNISNNVHNAMGQDENEQIKLLPCDVLASNERLVLQAEHGTSFKDSRHSGEFKEYNSVKTALLNSSLNDFSETVLGGSIQGMPCNNTEQVNGGDGDFGKYGGDSQVHLLNGNLSVNCNKTTQSNLEAVNQQLQGEQLKTPNPSIVGEVNSKKENESHVNKGQLVHVTTLSSNGSPEKSILEINGASDSESKIAEIEDCQLPSEGQSGSACRRTADEEYDQVIDSKTMHDRIQVFELERLSEDCITVSATACCTKVSNVSPERRPFYENNIENLRFTSPRCPTTKADCSFMGNDMLINNRCTTSGLQLRDDNSSRDTSMHCDDLRDVPGNFEQQTSMSTYPEINEMLCEDESLVPNHGHLLHQSEFSEVSVDIIPNTKDSIGSGAENPSGLLQHTLLAQSVGEFDHASREIEESHVEDAQAQSFNENHGHLLHQSEFSEVSVDIISNNKDSIGSGAENPSGLFQHTLLAQSVGEFDHASREIEESHVEDAQAQSFNENHGHLLHQSEFSEVSVDIISNTKDSIGSGAENPSALFQHTQLAQSVGEFDHASREIEESHAEDAQAQSFNENHGHLLHQSEFSEVSVDIISNNKDSFGSGAENPSGLFQHTLLAQSVGEFDHASREIEESHVEDAQAQSFNENHGHLLHQSEFSEVSVDIISNTDSIGSGAENPSGLLQHTLLAQSVREFDHASREIEESHVEDAQGQSFNENHVVYNCNNKQCLAVTNDQVSLADDNYINEDYHLSEFQKPGAVVDVDSQDVDNILHLDGDPLPTNIASSKEIKEKNLFEVAFEECNIHTGEHNASNHHIQAMPENKDGNRDVDERAELLQMDNAKKGSYIFPLVEVQLNDNIISSEFDSSIKVSEDPSTKVVAWKSEEQCSLSENSKLLASDNPTFNARIPQGSEASSLNSKNYSDEAETNISEKDEFPNTDMQHLTKGDNNFAEDSNKIIHLKKSVTKSKQEVPTVKPPPKAAPFSDEWLAAVEAAGEEILTMKSGAVQNSPPDKPQHEPGPWSPVRRKNQAIGPFDCTKHNIQHSGSQ